MFEDLKRNIEQEKKIVADMRSIQVAMEEDSRYRGFYFSSLKSLGEQLVLLNRAVPDLLKEWSPFKKTEDGGQRIEEKKKETVSMSYVSPSTKEKRYITINKKDRGEFLEKLKMSEGALAGIKKIKAKEIKEIIYKPGVFVKMSNSLFRGYADRLIPRFGKLARDLRKANIHFLLSSYLSMGIMMSVVVFFLGLLIYGGLLVVDLGNWTYFFLPFGLVGGVLFLSCE